jgi:hypothetical protein
MVLGRAAAIADDGTTTILCFQMGDYLQASPGGYFEPVPTAGKDCNDFRVGE